MSSSIGKQLKISLFGESHGPAIGVVIDGLPAGIRLEQEKILNDMARRRASGQAGATQRREADVPKVLSGLYKSRTTGTPLMAYIANSTQHSSDYAKLAGIPRPSHADYTSIVKYAGQQDLRGGGHFSGRLTAPLVFAGAVARAYLEQRCGAVCASHLAQIGSVKDDRFDPLHVNKEQLVSLYNSPFPVLNEQKGAEMQQLMEEARMSQDSLGGMAECAIVGLPVGIGDPMFDGLESKIAAALFGVPAVKAVEFGDGVDFAGARGSQVNDGMHMQGGRPALLSNHCGGILGGISSGAPLIVRTTFKPTPSISLPQQTVDMAKRKDTELVIEGRHDSCLTVRGMAAAEAAILIAVADAMLCEVNKK
ncbi:MAG: chorismate synthase [Christensenellaceae bacterium]|nr:chorismate synthase [Christensenellaceae bacterium]